MKKLNVINLYKINIVHKNIKNKQLKLFAYSLLICFVSVFLFSYFTLVNKNISTAVKVFNPIAELYRDVEAASFVGASNNEFIVPIKTEKYKINPNNIVFEITSSIMVYAPANGVIFSIDDGQNKLIKIKHADDLFSCIENVEIVGVKVGDIVKQGKEIATGKVGEFLIFSVEQDGKKVNNFYLNKSYIKWETN